ncbi:MAG: GDP-mannose 4,6-dehydratase [Candidatus Aenigmarchaeota archaeon]|nr:GDP-mannose 4,6-dehydratase [Candidatus Aenigmarchaeota archaeon]
MENPKVIVTGCAGFIGSHLTERLLGMGYEVTGVDCLTDYYSPRLKEKNMKCFLGGKNFTFIRRDINDIDMEKLIADAGCIFHLAAQPGVRASWGRSFEAYTKNNITATQKLLEVCKGSEIRFVFSSSSSVYGDTNELPIREESAKNPLSPYGVTKLAAENLCRLYFENHGIQTISLRYFTVYGPRQRPDMAFSKFIGSMIGGESITIYGDGGQTRDFTYVADTVDANISAMNWGRPGEAYNIGGGSNISIKEVIGIIEMLLDKEAKVSYDERQKGDVKNTCADTTKAAADLVGYRPKTKIKEGLRLQIDSIISG